MLTVAIVPARGGSKGFPDKNIAKIRGKTLIELAIEVAVQCPDIDDVYISTDSREYEAIACSAGAQTLGLRPKELSTDTTPTADVVFHMLNRFPKTYDTIVLLQPTSPLRQPKDVSAMLELMKRRNANAVVAVSKIDEPHPFKLKKIDDAGFLAPFIEGGNSEIPRQQLPAAYRLTGAIYIVDTQTFRNHKSFFPEKTLPYLMDKTINIDSREDYEYLKFLVDKKTIRLFGINHGF